MLKQPKRSEKREDGQALLEFVLTIPILLLLVLGIIDFGRVLFTYAQASNQLRDALRLAEVLGSDTTDPYLDCTRMDNIAGDLFFTTVDPEIYYIKASDSSILPADDQDCNVTGEVTASEIENGDILHIEVISTIDFITLGFIDFSVDFQFSGQRTIITTIPFGSTLNDDDRDGLDDRWERSYFADTNAALATADPDGDGCNNGCEETRGSDPTIDDTKAVPPEDTNPGWIPAPQTTYNFKADVNCANGRVSFSWDALPSIPDKLQIRDSDTDAVVYTLISPGTAACNNCDIIATNGNRTYYAVVFTNYTNSDSVVVEVQSVYSRDSSAFCTPPPTPMNFTATMDSCATGNVSFAWDDLGIYPTSAEIRLSSDDSVVAIVSDTTTTSCADCANIFVGQTLTFYMVTINGIPPGEIEGTSSNTSTVDCSAAGSGTIPTGTSSISGNVWEDTHGGGCDGTMHSTQESYAQGITVTLLWPGDDGNFATNGDNVSVTQDTNAGGFFQFPSLAADNYRISVNYASEGYNAVSGYGSPGLLQVALAAAYNLYNAEFFGLCN